MQLLVGSLVIVEVVGLVGYFAVEVVKLHGTHVAIQKKAREKVASRKNEVLRTKLACNTNGFFTKIETKKTVFLARINW